jgi:RHS repeat-associated protein
LESCYPYGASDGLCADACPGGQEDFNKIIAWYQVNPTAESLKDALYNYGPLVTLMAVQTDFFYYQSGIYSHSWGVFEGYHSALIVGYDDAEQYFIVKSSWGTDWGETGYSRIAYSEISSETKFGFWTVAYETVFPMAFPTIDGISRNVGMQNDNSNVQDNANTSNGNEGNQEQPVDKTKDTHNEHTKDSSQQEGRSDPATLTSSVIGFAKDEAGKVLEGVVIETGKYKATTDSSGFYQMLSVLPGDYILKARKTNYATAAIQISIAPETTLTKNIVLTRQEVASGFGWKRGKADAISPQKAWTYYTAQKETQRLAKATAPLAGLSQPAAITTEIQELARALHYNPAVIYNYVKLNIDYIPYFGSHKGATLTYLEGSGNDFDQASLLVALLRESQTHNSSISDVKYVIGEQVCADEHLARWLGVNAGTPIIDVLKNGGIPVARAEDGAIHIIRVWVSVVIYGFSIRYDPAFKFYTSESRMTVGTAMGGYDVNSFISSATNGAAITNDYVMNLNETNIKNQLDAYSNNMINYIKANEAYRNKDVKDAFGGRSIDRTYTVQSVDDLAGTYTGVSYVDEQNGSGKYGIDNLSAKMRIQYGSINYEITTSELAGKRLTITHIAGSPALRLGDAVVATGAALPSGTNTLTLSMNHPYAAPYDQAGNPLGTYCDESAGYPLLNTGTYAIAYSFAGTPNDKLLSKQQQRLDGYLAQGLSSSSEPVLGETLNLIGMTYFREQYLINKMISAINDTVMVNHHSVGLSAKESNYYVDMRNIAYTTTSKIDDANAGVRAKVQFELLMLFSSALEHGILEQLLGVNNAVSTVKLLQRANAAVNKIFYVDSNNYSTILNQDSANPNPHVVGYSNINELISLVLNGTKLILPENGAMALNTWSGNGYITRYFPPANSEYFELVEYVIGGHYGGIWTLPVDQGTIDMLPETASDMMEISYLGNPDYSNISNSLTTLPISTSIEPVDMASGAYLHDHEDLGLGGAIPLGLTFSRTYDSRMVNKKGPLGYGWTHNYDISYKMTSDAVPALGGRQSVDAAAFIVALYVGLDVMKSDSIQNWVIASLISKWAVDQLVNNAVSVTIGKKTMEFNKLSNGSYSPPPGITTQLINNGDVYSLRERFGMTMSFNADKKLSQIKDVDGNSMTLTYSGANVTSVSDAFNRTLTIAYAGDMISSVSDSADPSRSVSYGYDGYGNLITYTDPEGKVWSYGYNTDHRMSSLTNPLNIVTAMNTYDSLGRVKTQTVPRQGGANVTYNFYFSGFQNQEEDPNFKTITYYYDLKGREYRITDQLGNSIQRTYDGQNHIVGITDQLNKTTTYTYDGNHNLMTVTNALGHTTTHSYDFQFRLTDTNSPLTYNTRRIYDVNHHPTGIRNAVENTTMATYYSDGFTKGYKHTVTDGRGTVTTLTYDNYGNPLKSAIAGHPAVTFSYDRIGRMVGLTDQVGATTGFFYDKRNLLRSRTDSLGQSSNLGYDNAGRLTSKTDRKNNTVTYTYTPTDKPDTITYPDMTMVHFTYNQLDNLTAIQEPVGTTRYVLYDAANRLKYMIDPNGFTVSYNYDQAGNLIQINYPRGKTVTYEYDKLNRLWKVHVNGLTATYNYDATSGRLTGLTQFNGTTIEYGYDNAYQLTSLENKNSATVIAGYQFTLDRNGNRTRIVQNEPYAATVIATDASYAYNTQRNRLLSDGANSFTYDNEGQLDNGYGVGYSFDCEHRLIGIGASAQFIYNAHGNRLQATRNGVVTRYIYDAAGNLLAEADGLNNITRYYIYGQGLLAMVTFDNQVYCYHYNAAGSTVAVTNSSRVVVNKYAYDSFGNITGQQEAPGLSQPFKYVGRHGVMTEPNGFYYMRARYYDPHVGRFISEDPIGFDAGDVNLYAYVGNNPVVRIDPSGLWDDDTHEEFAGLDHGRTNPWNPFSTQLHFTKMKDIEGRLAEAIRSGNEADYKKYVHMGQDSFNPAHQQGVLAHIWLSITGVEPDNPDTYKVARAEMMAWTANQRENWKNRSFGK